MGSTEGHKAGAAAKPLTDTRASSPATQVEHSIYPPPRTRDDDDTTMSANSNHHHKSKHAPAEEEEEEIVEEIEEDAEEGGDDDDPKPDEEAQEKQEEEEEAEGGGDDDGGEQQGGDEEEDEAAAAGVVADAAKPKRPTSSAPDRNVTDKELYPEEDAADGPQRRAAEGRRKAREACEKAGIRVKEVPEDADKITEYLKYYSDNQKHYAGKSIAQVREDHGSKAVASYWLPDLTTGDVLAMSKGAVRLWQIGCLYDKEGYPWAVLPAGASPKALLPKNVSETKQAEERNRLTLGKKDNAARVALPKEEWCLITPSMEQLKSKALPQKALIEGTGLGKPHVLNRFRDVVTLRLLLQKCKETGNRARKTSSGSAPSSSSTKKATSKAEAGGGKKAAKAAAKQDRAELEGEGELPRSDEARAAPRHAETLASERLAPALSRTTNRAAGSVERNNVLAEQRDQSVEKIRAQLRAMEEREQTHYVETLLASYRCEALLEFTGGEQTPVDAVAAYLLPDPKDLSGSLEARAKWLEGILKKGIAIARDNPELPASQRLLSALSSCKDLMEIERKAKPSELAGYMQTMMPAGYALAAALLRRLATVEAGWRKQVEDMIQQGRRATQDFEQQTRAANAEALAAGKRADEAEADRDKLRAEVERLRAQPVAPAPSPARAKPSAPKRAREESAEPQEAPAPKKAATPTPKPAAAAKPKPAPKIKPPAPAQDAEDMDLGLPPDV